MSNSATLPRQTGAMINQFLSSQHFYDLSNKAKAAGSFEKFQKCLKDFKPNTGEAHYEAYKKKIKVIFEEVRISGVNAPLFHEFMEHAHNHLFYQINWAEPVHIYPKQLKKFYREDLDENGFVADNRSYYKVKLEEDEEDPA